MNAKIIWSRRTREEISYRRKQFEKSFIRAFARKYSSILFYVEQIDRQQEKTCLVSKNLFSLYP